MSDAFARRIKLKYHATFNGVRRLATLDTKATGYHGTRGFPFRGFFPFFCFFFLLAFRPHARGILFIEKRPRTHRLMKKKRVSAVRYNWRAKRFFSSVSEMFRFNKALKYIVGNVYF